MSLITFEDIINIENLKEDIVLCCSTAKDKNISGFECVKKLKTIVDNIFLRIFEKFEVKNLKYAVELEPYNFIETLKSSSSLGTELGSSSDGFATIKLLYNFDISKHKQNQNIYNLRLDNYNYNWTINLLDTILHEGFHCVQDLMFEDYYNKSNNWEKTNSFALESYLNKTANNLMKSKIGDFEICEISARKFALEQMLEFYEQNLQNTNNNNWKTKFNIYLSSSIIRESEDAYRGFNDNIEQAREEYLLNFSNYKEYINNYFNDIIKYYKSLDVKKNEIAKNILEKNKNLQPFSYLGLESLYCLYVEYASYNNLTKTEKENFSKVIEDYNIFCYDNQLRKSVSNINIFLSSLKQNELDKEKSGD